MANIPRKILLIDSNPDDGKAIQDFLLDLRPRWDLVLARSCAEACEVLTARPFDIVIMDYILDDGSAFDLFPLFPNTPSLVITAQGGEHIAVECLHRGAYDYMVKDAQKAYIQSLPSTMSNIMARKATELALIESEARYLDLFDNAPDMYFQVSEEGMVLSVNQRGADQLGYTVEELVDGEIWRVVHPDDLAYVQEEIKNVLDTPEHLHQIEFRKVTKGGDVMHVGESLTVQDDPGKPRVIRILCRDQTAQKKAEEHAQSLQARLARSERMESIGLLAGGVAHDLNNILGPMVAYPDLLLRDLEPDEDASMIIQDIRSSANRAVAIIRDLLTMARRGRYELKPVALNNVVHEFMESSSYKELLASHPEVRPDFQLDENLPWISGASTNLGKVLMNLVINAFESMPKGGNLRVETFHHDAGMTMMGYERIPPNDYVALKISDEGLGIEAADQERMFEPFFTKKRMGRSGSGLGLAVVYGVIKDHHGFIDVKSRVNEGTTISVYIPVTKHDAGEMDANQPVDIHGNEHLLIVDDVSKQRDLASKLLEGMGYTVDTAIHGHDALKRMRERAAREKKKSHAYDLVLLDMIMEDTFDGLDAFKEILKLYPKQKCIIVSGYAETSRVREAQSLGVLLYLPKPYTREELGRAIRTALATD